MAASAVLTGITIATAAAPLIKPLVLWVEKLFGPGTGAAKLQTVVDGVTTVAQQLGKAGLVTDAPDVAKITAQIQAVVDAEKQPGGALSTNPSAPSSIASVAGTVKLPAGLLGGVGQILVALEAANNPTKV